jgi:hypothetical protein
VDLEITGENMRHAFFIPFSLFILAGFSLGADARPMSLFDGKSFAGWDGDTRNIWRIEDGCIVGGSLKRKVPAQRVSGDDAELWRLRPASAVQAAGRFPKNVRQFGRAIP